MSISSKTRKTLWAKSGNRCSLCRIELVQNIDSSKDDLIIGEECHIISAKENGPRGKEKCNNEFDHYNNLILLCANDHKRIDELTEIYSVDKLQKIKSAHELWVKTTLEKDVLAFTNDRNNLKSLSKISTGKQLIDLINGTHMFQFDHDELDTNEEAEIIGGFIDELRDVADILSDLGFVEISKMGLQYNEEIKRIENLGFSVFGLRRKIRLRNNKNEDMGIYGTSTLTIVRKDNPSIIDNFLIAKIQTSDISFI